MANLHSKFGPGLLVTAAFIGPGTVTTASIAGANFGFALLWTLLFSVLATMILQEMTARLGLVSRQGLAEALRNQFAAGWRGRGAIGLVILAVGFGNAAYQVGNIAGTSLGMQGLTGMQSNAWALLTGALAATLLATGRYQLIESTLVAIVLLMSTVFLLTLLAVDLPWRDMIAGLLTPEIPTGGVLTAIALVGTTVVPYNLFLHASAVQSKWAEDQPLEQSLSESRWDTSVSVGLGGLITLAVMSTSAVAFFGTDGEFSATSMADQLEPLLGSYARYFFATGLLAAGLTSAVTAPLAAAYAVCGVMGWPQQLSSPQFRAVWLTVLLVGTTLAALGSKPLTAILIAQAANGFLLPICAIFLLVTMNNSEIMSQYRNGPVANLLGSLVVAVTLGLSGIKLLQLGGYL